MYNSIICHLYILPSPPKVRSPSVTISSPLPSSTLTPVFPSCSQYTVACVFIYLFFCLIPSPFLPSPPTLHPSVSYQSVLCVYESVSILLVYFIREVPHISKIVWYLSFSGWLISLSIMFSRSIHDILTSSVIG